MIINKSCVTCICLYLLLFFPVVTYAKSTSCEYTPIFLIHGSGLNSETWIHLKQALIKKGYPDSHIFAANLIPNDGSNSIAAREFIAPAADRLLVTANKQLSTSRTIRHTHNKIDIVAHSMGAVSGRWYTAFISPEKVRRFISIAGSNHGTNALCGFNGDGNKEMCPAFSRKLNQSIVQVKLNNNPKLRYDETPFGTGIDGATNSQLLPPDDSRRISYFTIYKESDQWIKPWSSATLQGTTKLKKEIQLPGPVTEVTPGNFKYTGKASHDDMPKTKSIINLVYLLLNAKL